MKYSYIGLPPTEAPSSYFRQSYLATEGQTHFANMVYQPGFIDIWINGSKLTNITEFTAIDGTTFDLVGITCVAGDDVQAISFGSYTVPGAYNQAQSDARYLKLIGGVASGDVTVPSLNGGQLAGFRNKIINGNFDVWQRGISFGAGGVYTADGFAVHPAGASISRQAGTDGSTYSIYIIGPNPYCVHRIESLNSASLIGKSVTISFYALYTGASATTVTVSLLSPTVTDDYSVTTAEGTSSAISLTTGWAKYSVTLPTLSANVIKGLQLQITFNSASTVQSYITQVQLEAGSVATPFEFRSVGTELALCQRYYCLVQARDSLWFNTADFYDRGATKFPVEMRVPPSATVYAQSSGTPNCVRNATLTTDVAVTGSLTNTQGMQYIITTAGTANNVASWFIRASAEL